MMFYKNYVKRIVLSSISDVLSMLCCYLLQWKILFTQFLLLFFDSKYEYRLILFRSPVFSFMLIIIYVGAIAILFLFMVMCLILKFMSVVILVFLKVYIFCCFCRLRHYYLNNLLIALKYEFFDFNFLLLIHI